MPLTFGIPLGILIALVGMALYFATRRKRAALLLVGLGAVIMAFTFVAVILALNSGM
jgi:hypothetical protein